MRAEDDGYLVVLQADTEGHLRVLFPIDPTDDNFVRGGKKYEVEGRGGRDAFDVGDRAGRGTVYAAVSRAPFRFDEFILAIIGTTGHSSPGGCPRIRKPS